MSDNGQELKLTQLGSKTPLPKSPDEAVLETFKNPYPNQKYNVRFCCPEFTSLCPITGQPDYACIYLDYVPNEVNLESKSLKLFLGSFREHGSFHESCTMNIATRIIQATNPHWLRISGFWYARGGISLDIFYQTGDCPKGVYVPYVNVGALKGRI